jgi:hypothetical protein
MARITKPPAVAQERFLAGAPDHKRRGVMRGRKEQITITVDPALLAEIDRAAQEMGLTRTAWLTVVAKRALRQVEREAAA